MGSLVTAQNSGLQYGLFPAVSPWLSFFPHKWFLLWPYLSILSLSDEKCWRSIRKDAIPRERKKSLDSERLIFWSSAFFKAHLKHSLLCETFRYLTLLKWILHTNPFGTCQMILPASLHNEHFWPGFGLSPGLHLRTCLKFHSVKVHKLYKLWFIVSSISGIKQILKGLGETSNKNLRKKVSIYFRYFCFFHLFICAFTHAFIPSVHKHLPSPYWWPSNVEDIERLAKLRV